MENGFQKEREQLKKMKRTVESCPFRTRYHIMPPVGWLNDPNGLCQFRGVYHAYFQYSPLNVHGGGGFWGHCMSRDLLHWEYKEPVLTTDIPEDESGVYSGSALIENDRMYLFYTGNVKKPGDYDYIDAGRISTQILTESEDGQHMSEKVKLLGMEDYPEDMTQHIRDPKVWKENGRYFMVLGARRRDWDSRGNRSDKGGMLLYTSGDKRKWSLYQEYVPEKPFGYMWECPDIFRLGGRKILSFCPQGLPSEAEKYQNIYQSGYSFLEDGQSPEESFHEWDMGFDFYAPQTFETEDKRRILIGWAGMPDTEKIHRNLSVKNGWQHCLTIPTELTFHDGRIFRMPVRELEDLPWAKMKKENGRYHWADRTVRLQIKEINGNRQTIRLGNEKNGLTILADGDRVELSFSGNSGNPSRCGGGRGRRTSRVEGMVREMLVIIDSSIVEVFVNSGETVFTTRIYLEKEERELDVSGCSGCEIVAI